MVQGSWFKVQWGNLFRKGARNHHGWDRQHGDPEGSGCRDSTRGAVHLFIVQGFGRIQSLVAVICVAVFTTARVLCLPRATKKTTCFWHRKLTHNRLTLVISKDGCSNFRTRTDTKPLESAREAEKEMDVRFRVESLILDAVWYAALPTDTWCGVQGSGFRVQGSGFRVWSLGVGEIP